MKFLSPLAEGSPNPSVYRCLGAVIKFMVSHKARAVDRPPPDRDKQMVCLGLAMGGASGPGTGFSGGRDRWHHLQNLHHLAERWSPKRCPAVYWLGLLGSAPNVCCGFVYAYSLSRHGWPIPQSKDKKTHCVCVCVSELSKQQLPVLKFQPKNL